MRLTWQLSPPPSIFEKSTFKKMKYKRGKAIPATGPGGP
jgi:hypothetical protein